MLWLILVGNLIGSIKRQVARQTHEEFPGSGFWKWETHSKCGWQLPCGSLDEKSLLWPVCLLALLLASSSALLVLLPLLVLHAFPNIRTQLLWVSNVD